MFKSFKNFLGLRMKKKLERWRLNPREISSGWSGSSSGTSGIFDRKLKITGRRLRLRYEPTGVAVEGEIPDGHYSRKEMQQKTEQLMKVLFLELESKVAKKLRIRGIGETI